MSCKRIDTLKDVFPGWSCCQCRCYNGYQHTNCRACNHPHCYLHDLGELLPILSQGGKVLEHYDPASRTTRPVVGTT